MIMTVNQRIAWVMKELDHNNNSFAKSIGVTPQGLHGIITGKNKPSYDMLFAIASKYTDVNIDWLVMGRGEMMHGKTPTTTLEETTRKSEDSDFLRRQLDECNKNLTYFRERVVALEDRGRGAGSAVAVPSQQ